VSRLATVSLVLVVDLLLTCAGRGCSAWSAPVLSGAVAGVATVSLGFGQVHGLTLGFGTTLIGEAVDYSILFVQRADRQPPGPLLAHHPPGRAHLHRRLCRPALLSGFPGWRSWACYSIAGLRRRCW
jgi:predicted exporter